MGPAGIEYLISELIYRRAVMPSLERLKAAMDHPAAILDVVEVLGYGIRWDKRSLFGIRMTHRKWRETKQ